MTKRQWSAGGILTALLLSAYAAPAADTWYVALGGNHTDFTNWITAATNIQDAVNAATDGDTVLVSNGTYYLTNHIVITAGITVRSFTEEGHDLKDTIINGNYSAGTYTNRCLLLSNANAIVDGFTITNGSSTVSGYHGCGILMYNGVVRNCRVVNNRGNFSPSVGKNGGGIYMHSGTVSNCFVADNIMSAGSLGCYGGGIYMIGGLVTDSVVSNNAASAAGGISMNYSTSMVFNCTIVNNACDDWRSAGGVSLWTGGTLSNCTVRGNTGCVGGVTLQGDAANHCKVFDCIIAENTGYARDSGNTHMLAGGVYFVSYGLLQNSVVKGNIAWRSSAGGVFVSGGNSTIKSCTIVGNQAVDNASWEPNQVGGLIASNNTATIVNTVIYNNQSAGIASNWYTWRPGAGGLSNCTYSCLAPAVTGDGNTPSDPRFENGAADGTGNYRLRADSPCVNAGSNETWMTNARDIEGNRRIFHSRVDMGAYENFFKGTIFSIH